MNWNTAFCDYGNIWLDPLKFSRHVKNSMALKRKHGQYTQLKIRHCTKCLNCIPRKAARWLRSAVSWKCQAEQTHDRGTRLQAYSHAHINFRWKFPSPKSVWVIMMPHITSISFLSTHSFFWEVASSLLLCLHCTVNWTKNRFNEVYWWCIDAFNIHVLNFPLATINLGHFFAYMQVGFFHCQLIW